MPDKKPWGSAHMRELLNRIGMPDPDAAMSLVMALDFANRDDNAAKEITIAEELAGMHPTEAKNALAKDMRLTAPSSPRPTGRRNCA